MMREQLAKHEFDLQKKKDKNFQKITTKWKTEVQQKKEEDKNTKEESKDKR